MCVCVLIQYYRYIVLKIARINNTLDLKQLLSKHQRAMLFNIHYLWGALLIRAYFQYNDAVYLIVCRRKVPIQNKAIDFKSGVKGNTYIPTDKSNM